MTATETTVVIVDDHGIFRSGLRADLNPAIRVLGEAATVESAIAAIHEHRPTVVLLDVHLPGGRGGGGAEVVAGCADLLVDTRFLALSVSDSAEDVVTVIRAGARGYVTKSISGAEISGAVQRIADGDAVFSPRLAGFVLDAFGTVATAAASDELDLLSDRELEVMRLIARGYSYKEVAADLFISIKTVESHVSKVLRKLQLSNRHELTRWAVDRRILQAAEPLEQLGGSGAQVEGTAEAGVELLHRAGDGVREELGGARSHLLNECRDHLGHGHGQVRLHGAVEHGDVLDIVAEGDLGVLGEHGLVRRHLEEPARHLRRVGELALLLRAVHEQRRLQVVGLHVLGDEQRRQHALHGEVGLGVPGHGEGVAGRRIQVVLGQRSVEGLEAGLGGGGLAHGCSSFAQKFQFTRA